MVVRDRRADELAISSEGAACISCGSEVVPGADGCGFTTEGQCHAPPEQKHGFERGIHAAFRFVLRRAQDAAQENPRSIKAAELHRTAEVFALTWPRLNLRLPVRPDLLCLGDYVEARWQAPSSTKTRVIRGVVTELTETRVRIKYEWQTKRGRMINMGVSEVWRPYGQVTRVCMHDAEHMPGEGVRALATALRDNYVEKEG